MRKLHVLLLLLAGCHASTPIASLTNPDDRALFLDVRPSGLRLTFGKYHSGSCTTLSDATRVTLDGVAFHTASLGGAANAAIDRGSDCNPADFSLDASELPAGLDAAVIRADDGSAAVELRVDHLGARSVIAGLDGDRLHAGESVTLGWSVPSDTLTGLGVIAKPDSPDVQVDFTGDNNFSGRGDQMFTLPPLALGCTGDATCSAFPLELPGRLSFNAEVAPTHSCPDGYGCTIQMFAGLADLPVVFVRNP